MSANDRSCSLLPMQDSRNLGMALRPLQVKSLLQAGQLQSLAACAGFYQGRTGPAPRR